MTSLATTTHCADCNSEVPSGATCPNCATVVTDQSPSLNDTAEGFPRIDGYRTTALLGEGGMGSVYLAEDIALRRRVAIKTIRSSGRETPESRERFLREARVLATIEDPNIVRLYAYGTSGAMAYMVMEYVAGESLASALRRRGRLSPDETCRIVIEICRGLRSAATKGIVHRDIKPANILVDESHIIRLADFGLARSVLQPDAGLTSAGVAVGTPHYMSPEQASGEEITSASDVYSLGIVIYELLTGSRPFEARTPLAVIAKHLLEELPDPRTRVRRIPAGLVKLLNRMTSKNAEERPGYDAIIAELEAILARNTVALASVSGGQIAQVLLLAVFAYIVGDVSSRLVRAHADLLLVILFGAACAGVGIVGTTMIPRRGSRRDW